MRSSVHRPQVTTPPRMGSSQRRLDNRRSRKDRYAFDGVVCDPRQNLRVEVIDPTRVMAALAKPEQGVIERRKRREIRPTLPCSRPVSPVMPRVMTNAPASGVGV